MSTVAGIDFSGKAVDVVLLDETTPDAQWHRFELLDATPHDACRNLRHALPSWGWWEQQNVYLACLEAPRGQHIRAYLWTLPLFGAILDRLPPRDRLEVWSMPPAEWKKPFTGNGNAAKELVKARCVELGFGDAPDIPQDAYDAYGIAWAARELNAKAIAA